MSSGVSNSDKEVIFVEMKRKASRGIHGKLLGKGGFAKIYWCTSEGTGKAYVVEKKILVKTRAMKKLQAKIKIC
eukprot:708237-Ditylum_brightwellii.AAC.1